MSKNNNAAALPATMDRKLRSIRRRQAALAVLRAGAFGASALIVAMLAAMLADWTVTLFDTTVRTALTFSALTLSLVVLVVLGAPSLMAALQWKRAAIDADHEVPQLEERWTTVASFAQSAHQPQTETEKAMLQQVTSEAVTMERLVRPAKVANPASLRPAALALVGCSVVLAAFLAVNWPQTSVLWQRFWSPASDITATQLASVTGDVEIPRGESLALVTELSGLQRDSATIEIATGPEVVDRLELPHDEQNSDTFTYEVTAENSFRYRVQAGDDRTPWHQVTVIEFPILAEVRLTVTAPDYVDRPKYEKTLIPSRLKVVQGSRMELRMKPAAELEQLELTVQLDAAAQDAEPLKRQLLLQPDANGWYRFQTQLLEDMSFSPRLLNSHGLTNEDKRVCRIQVVEDKAPVARIIAPTNEMAVTTDDVVDIKFEAHDDHGIATAELVIYDESETEAGEEPKILAVKQIPLGDQELQKHVMAETRLDLEELGVEEGAQISYSIRVTDNRMVAADPDGMRAQLAEAKPGEGDEESQLADASEGEANKKRPEPPGDGLEKMLADAGEIPQTKTNTTNRETEGETGAETKAANRGPEGEEERDPSDNPASESGKDVGAPTTEEAETGKGGEESKSRETEDSRKTKSDRTPGDADPGENDPAAGPEGADNDDKDGQPDKADNGRPTEQNANEDGEIQDAPTGANKEQTDVPSKDNASPGKTADGRQPENDKQPSNDGSPSEKNSKPASNSQSPDSANVKNLQQPNGENKDATAKDNERKPREPNEGDDAPRPSVVMNSQQSETGQNVETNRRRLKIAKRLAAVAAASEREKFTSNIRDRIVRIDEMLAAVETNLNSLVEREIADADRGEQFTRLDKQLGEVEQYIAELREETKDGQFAFVGLQMLDIGRSHVTPARDRVFAGIRAPLGGGSDQAALQEILRARELLAALLKRYERVARDKKLKESLEEAIKMYTVYVEKMHILMREARQNKHPLDRKMMVFDDIEQEYLDRYAEVQTLRREMMAEFGRMLADDPRLMSRYMDLIKRRDRSMRNQLSELAERQEELATELSGWRQADAAQRADFWPIVADLRLQVTSELAKNAAELAERIEKQMPLVLKTDQGTAALVINHAKRIETLSRQITFDVRKWGDAAEEKSRSPLLAKADTLAFEFGEMDAALDQLRFENEAVEEVTDFVDGRLLESRTVADLADQWLQYASHLEQQRYHGLAEVDQQRVGLDTELLRSEMQGIQDDLEQQFASVDAGELPEEIVAMVDELRETMESITFNQSAATFALTKDDSKSAETQQQKALDGFEQAEKLMDKLRRAVVTELDEYDEELPELRDPTLDRFLAQLEREPGIQARLGIPGRRRNLRAVADQLDLEQNGTGLLNAAGEEARARMRAAMNEKREGRGKDEEREREMSEEERQQLAAARDMQQMLEDSLKSIREKVNDPKTPAEQRKKLEEMARGMQRMLDAAGRRNADRREWQEIAKSDQAQAILKALAAGKALPNEQWNKLLSTLDDGLWQVKGRTPPEEFRKAIEQYQDRIRQLVGGEAEE